MKSPLVKVTGKSDGLLFAKKVPKQAQNCLEKYAILKISLACLRIQVLNPPDRVKTWNFEVSDLHIADYHCPALDGIGIGANSSENLEDNTRYFSVHV